MERIKLSARQIQWMDELARDKRAIEDVLNIAINYATNRKNELMKQEQDWWKEMSDLHGLDVWKEEYVIKHEDGAVYIVHKGKRNKEE
jgi:DNA-binding protein YbaB